MGASRRGALWGARSRFGGFAKRIHRSAFKPERRKIDQKVVRALSSFITRSGDYVLARLELSLRFPELAPPPTLERLPDASERTLRARWERLEQQLEAIGAYLREIERSGDTAVREDATFRWLLRIVRELDQYGRALRWVLTVTERDSPHINEEPP